MRSGSVIVLAFLTALTTEHFVLQTAAGATVSEAATRASLYLLSLSSSLVAMGFRVALPGSLPGPGCGAFGVPALRSAPAFLGAPSRAPYAAYSRRGISSGRTFSRMDRAWPGERVMSPRRASVRII